MLSKRRYVSLVQYAAETARRCGTILCWRPSQRVLTKEAKRSHKRWKLVLEAFKAREEGLGSCSSQLQAHGITDTTDVLRSSGYPLYIPWSRQLGFTCVAECVRVWRIIHSFRGMGAFASGQKKISDGIPDSATPHSFLSFLPASFLVVQNYQEWLDRNDLLGVCQPHDSLFK